MVFEDATGRRRWWLAGGVVFAALVAALWWIAAASGGESTRSPWTRPTLGHALSFDAGAAPRAPLAAVPTSHARTTDDDALPLPANTHLVFTLDDDDARASVRAHADAMGAIAPDWFRATDDDCTLEILPDADATPPAGDALLLPRLANFDGRRWTSDTTSRLLADEDARACLAEQVVDELVQRGADGLNVDFEAIAVADADNLVAWMEILREQLHAHGLRLTIDVAVADPAFDLPRLGRIADAVILMAYDQHHENGTPGPIAARSWLHARIDEARAVVDPTRLVVALGSYCYDWPTAPAGSATARTVPEAFALAADVGVAPITVVDTGNLRFDYADPQGGAHEVWCLDATAGADALALLEARGISRTALWRAGSEDPSWWPVLAARDRDARVRALQEIPAGPPRIEGTGDVVARTVAARSGAREVELAASGAVLHARVEPPAHELLTRMGDPGAQIVLTFDDGPHPTWTPAILDVLAEHGATATFFAIGEAAEAHPAIVRRTVAEGHLLGNHTWDHAAFDEQSSAQIAAQLERTSSLLQSLAGREIRFVRAPYLGMLAPDDAAGWSAIAPALAADYAYVHGSVDAGDWRDVDADTIVAQVLAQVDAGGRVVVMHDGGGDRSATVAALRTLIPELRRRGHEIVGLDAALGRTRDEVAPPLPHAARVAAIARGAATDVRALGVSLLPWLFAVCTALAALRIVALTVLALRRPPSPSPVGDRSARLVTVLLPAYNEGKVIAATLASLREGDHQALEIIVVDDGSTDDTAAVVARIAAIDPRVRCLRKANGGKASAANFGLARAHGEIVVAVDADTQIAKDAIARMVAHFDDPRVDAVCGNVEVGNVRSFLTAFQAIEYVTSQNFDRRAFAAVDAIGVVPGALGAWRRKAVLAVGGYSHDTLVEDADLTLAVLRNGGKITYEPRAIARTEAPETLGALWKQRFRWTYGTFQCLAKHRAALGRGAAGCITLPNALVFQVLFPLVSPIGDLALVAAIATGAWSAVLSGYLGFLAMDLLASMLAFRLDRKPMRWLPLLLVQRFTYRQFLYLVSLRAMLAVLGGSRHGWRKLERTATVIALPTTADVAVDRAA